MFLLYQQNDYDFFHIWPTIIYLIKQIDTINQTQGQKPHAFI